VTDIPARTSEPSLIDRERALLRHLASLIGERGRASAEIEASHQATTPSADQELLEVRQRLQARLAAEQASLAATRDQARQQIDARFQNEYATRKKEYEQRAGPPSRSTTPRRSRPASRLTRPRRWSTPPCRSCRPSPMSANEPSRATGKAACSARSVP
jgi:hypothetical protein